MLTGEEDVEAAALRAQGWSVAAIARHLDRDPKTIRAYLNGQRVPGQRRSSWPDPFAPFADYVAARLAEDRHVWATALYDEVRSLGYAGSYPSFTRALRSRGLRPRCEACAGVTGRETVDIEHPPGQEQQWDWADLPGAPWGGTAHVLVGALSSSSQARAVLAEAQDLPHLVEALDGVLRRFGGTARRWRVDRMATVIDPHTGRLQPGFAAVAKYYRVGVDPCPPRRGNRKGVVEKAIHFMTQRWWRTARLERAAGAQAAAVSASWATPSRCSRCRSSPTRPPSRSSAWSRPTAPSPSAATTTRSRPAWSPRPSPCGTGSARSSWRCRRRPGWGWPATGSPQLVPAAPCGWLAMPPRWSGASWPRSPPSCPASARPTAHPAPRPWPPPASLACFPKSTAR